MQTTGGSRDADTCIIYCGSMLDYINKQVAYLVDFNATY